MIKEIANHRSIRKYKSSPIDEEVLSDILHSAARASTCGNMQLYSLVVTLDARVRAELAPCHFNQAMVTEAPCVVTVCADVHRFSKWCEQRDAEPAYDNFEWFLNAATDALLAAENLALAAEAQPAQSSPASQSGRKTVSGVVLDAETGQPVVGAQVWLKDTTIGSVTDSSGRFEIAYSGNYSVLNVSFLGYETREVVFSPGAAVTVKLTSRW